jgi:crossover junction endodeoxyribonuclease RuvC
MRVLGIDPGYAIVGIGVVESEGNKLKPVDFSAILTNAKTEYPDRLKIIYDRMNEYIKLHNPEAISIEKLFFQNNATTAMKVAEARGVIILAARENNIPIFEYTPLQVKSAVVGYGKAVKSQVMEMTRILLGLKERPKPDDTADALALAICHIHTASSKLNRLK